MIASFLKSKPLSAAPLISSWSPRTRTSFFGVLIYAYIELSNTPDQPTCCAELHTWSPYLLPAFAITQKSPVSADIASTESLEARIIQMIFRSHQMACDLPRPFQLGVKYQIQRGFSASSLTPCKFKTYLLNWLNPN